MIDPEFEHGSPAGPAEGCRVVVVGASAGGVDALRTLCAGLGAGFRVPILVVLHLPATRHSALPEILSRAGPLPAVHARHHEALAPGRIYVAPPGRHLLVEGGRAVLTTAPRENRHRPSVDVLFRSAARDCGAGAVGVLLSGTLDDGTAGAVAIHAHGGRILVQDPTEALYPGMPTSAILSDHPSLVLPVAELARTLVTLAQKNPPAGGEGSDTTAKAFEAAEERGWTPSPFPCPECHGVLSEREETPGLVTYRCRIGHALSPDSLLVEQGSALEATLWAAVRLFEERIELCQRMARRVSDRGYRYATRGYEKSAREAQDRAKLLRSILEDHESGPADVPMEEFGDGEIGDGGVDDGDALAGTR